LSVSEPPLISACKQCAQPLAPGTVACPQCHALVHADQLERLSQTARQMEANRRLHEAHEQWVEALLLLPVHSKQADWIKGHLRELEHKIEVEQIPAPAKDNWAKKFGPVGPIAILLAKSKGLLTAVFKLKFLLTFFAFIGVYWGLYGATFGIGFALLILIHELGHFVDVKRRGLPADMPVFLPGLGAYVRWQALGVSLETRAGVSLAGPLAGLAASVACLGIWWATGDQLWAALARTSAVLNVLNLIPVWMLDGGQAAAAMDKTERLVLLTACLALWLIFKEGMFFLVAAGATYRLFTKDFPVKPSRMITAYFLVVLGLLGMVMWFVPARGIGLE